MSEAPVTKTQWDGQRVIATVEGDVDLHRSPQLQQQLLELLDQNPDTVVVDLSAVPYMDSSGVASLVKLLSRTRSQDVQLVLASPTDKVRSILEITRLDSVFSIVDDPKEA
jgi:anti-sigma B factor antagonist